MSSALVLLLLLPTQPASQPASQPAAFGGPQGTASDVYGELTLLFEISEKALGTQESWTLRNASGKTIPADQLQMVMPAGSKKLRLDEASTGFHAAETGDRITADKPMGQEDRTLAGTYEVPITGSDMVIRRTLPFNMGRARVIFEELPGLTVTSNVEGVRRSRDLNGLKFAIWDFGAMKPGSEFELRIQGLPTQRHWPRNVALILGALIVGWAIRALRTGEVPGANIAAAIGPLSGRARRDRLVKAIEIVKRDFEAGKLNDKQYARRNEQLMQELAIVLREIEIEERQARHSGARPG